MTQFDDRAILARMKQLFTWAIFPTVLLGLVGLGVGFALSGDTPDDFTLSKAMFLIACALSGLAVIYWQRRRGRVWMQYFIVVIIFAVLGAASLAATQYVNRKRDAKLIKQAPDISLAFLIENHQLQIHNRGSQEVELWGSKLAQDGPMLIENEPRMIARDFFWFIDLAEFEQRMSALKVVPPTIGTTPFYAYVKDKNEQKATVKCLISVIFDGKTIGYRTANLGVRADWLDGW